MRSILYTLSQASVIADPAETLLSTQVSDPWQYRTSRCPLESYHKHQTITVLSPEWCDSIQYYYHIYYSIAFPGIRIIYSNTLQKPPSGKYGKQAELNKLRLRFSQFIQQISTVFLRHCLSSSLSPFALCRKFIYPRLRTRDGSPVRRGQIPGEARIIYLKPTSRNQRFIIGIGNHDDLFSVGMANLPAMNPGAKAGSTELDYLGGGHGCGV